MSKTALPSVFRVGEASPFKDYDEREVFRYLAPRHWTASYIDAFVKTENFVQGVGKSGERTKTMGYRRRLRKFLLVMKLTALFLMAGFLSVYAKGLSQNVTFSGEKVPLEAVFTSLKKQTGYLFLYRESVIRSSKPVTIAAVDLPLQEFLDELFRSQPLRYDIKGQSIFISQRSGSRIEKSASSILTILQDTSIRVRGKVVNENGPLAGVTVSVKKSNRTTVTDSYGEFVLNNVTEKNILVFSYVGYKTRELSAPWPTNVTIRLEKEIADLDQVVVMGYGSMQKKDLTGSVSVVNSEDIQDIPFMTVDNALAGKAAGVQVTKSDGTPGGAVRIRVRGSTSLLGGNDPLYVIDDVPIQVQSNYINPGFDVTSPVANDINGLTGLASGMSTAFVNGLNGIGGLNIDDIESISILKDASSTAIYGSKAANGVVIITTKRGKKDMRPQIMFSYYGTHSKPVTPDVLDGEQYRTLFRESAQNDYDYRIAAGRFIFPQLDDIVNHPDRWFGKENTDWIDETTRSSFGSNAEISIQGGGSASKYYTSLSYNNSPGVIIGSTYKRVSGKLNTENEIGKKFRFLTTLNISSIEQDITNGVYSQAIRARPDLAVYDSTGNFSSFSTMGFFYQGFQNPLALASALNKAKTFSLIGSVSGIFNITSWLRYKSTVSLNMQDYRQRNYAPSYLTIQSQNGFNFENNGGVGNNSNSHLANWFVENTLTFDKQYNEKHSLNMLAGTSYETRKTSFFSATGLGFPNDNILNNLSSAVTPVFVKGDDPSKPQSYLVSYYLRANYAFQEKYLVTFTGRADGSSKFGPSNKFGYFPSGAVAWRLSQENFLKNVSWIDDIKIRGSYGVTGTQNIGDQMYRTLYTPYSYNGASALVPTQLGNEGIKWESTKSADVGADMSFFNNRLQATLDYYHKQTSNALISLPISPSSSYSTMLYNVAELRNTGFEFSVQGDIIRNRNFRWNTSLNITWNRSKVTKLDEEANLGLIGNLTGLELGNTALIEGEPLGLIRGQKLTGIIKTEKELQDYKAALGANAADYPYLSLGDAMFVLDDSGFPSYNEIIGYGAPKYFGGFTQALSYKNFELNLYFTFSQGGQLMWGDGVSSVRFVGQSNANVDILKRYHEGNTNTNRPRLLYNDELTISNTSLSVYDASYIKLRTAALNYRLPVTPWMRNAGLHQVSAFLSATNLFTITSYPGNDPETSNDPYSVVGGYFDVSNFPVVRTISIGVKAGF